MIKQSSQSESLNSISISQERKKKTLPAMEKMLLSVFIHYNKLCEQQEGEPQWADL